MKRTFTLKALLGVTTFICLGVGSLFASRAWTPFVVTGVAVLLASGILAAIFRRGKSQAFWIGFVLFASINLWAMQSPYEHFLATSKAVDSMPLQSTPSPVFKWGSQPYGVRRLHAHLFCCVIVGILGGLIGRAQVSSGPNTKER